MPGFAPPQQHHPQQQDGQQVQHIQAGIWWPAADSARLRAAAHAWREMAAALSDVQAATQASALSVQADNQGKAIDAFETYWQKWAGTGGYLPSATEACLAMAKALEQYAQAVDDARTKVEELIAEVGTAIVIGVALSVLTVGISDVAAGAVSASLIASAAAVGVDLSAAAATIAATVLVGTAFGAVEAMAIDVVAIQPEKILIFHDQKSFSWQEVLQWGEMGALGGFLGGGSAALFRAGSDVLPESFSAVLDTRLGQIAAGSLLGGGTSALVDEVQYGQINPLDVAAGMVGGAAGGGVRAPQKLGPDTYADPVEAGRLPAFAGKKTSGIFHLPGDDVLGDYPLSSGYDGPAREIPKDTFPGFNNNIRSHVEAHAAALMRLNDMGQGDEAALEINRVPCPGRNGCAVNLPRMIPPGATLHVYGPDGYYKPWVGAPD